MPDIGRSQKLTMSTLCSGELKTVNHIKTCLKIFKIARTIRQEGHNDPGVPHLSLLDCVVNH